MRDSKVQILEFDETTLIDAYVDHRERAQVEEDNRRVRFLFTYLKTIGVGTMLIEEDYTDGDFLDDYANYYVRSDKEYPRRCRRIHFFRMKYTANTPRVIREQLLGANGPSKQLRAAYAGFSVVRPLPEAVVGRTVVATYDAAGREGTRHYPATHDYEAHLLGAAFTVRSLAFQEQDTVLAACATVALWSALHQTAALFQTGRKSPAQITQMATLTTFETRAFPSRGLTLAQMCAAIKSVGLEPEVVTCSETTPLLSMIYAYLNAKLPVVLIVHIETLGYHAITINGYLLASARAHTYETASATAPLIGGRGLRIQKLFGHDDQICPFARLDAHVSPNVPDYYEEQGLRSEVYFTGSWASDRQDPQGIPVPLRITPKQFIVPIYHKIRLTYLDIEGHVAALTRILNRHVIQNIEEVEWDIRLSHTTEWKQALRQGPADASTRERMLAWQLPKYLWVATLRGLNGTPVLEMLFDATGIRRSLPLLEILYFDAGIKTRLLGVGRVAKPEHFPASRRLIAFLRAQSERDEADAARDARRRPDARRASAAKHVGRPGQAPASNRSARSTATSAAKGLPTGPAGAARTAEKAVGGRLSARSRTGQRPSAG